MLKMILADDEPVITRGIQKLIDWKSLGFEIIGEYEDGRKALEGILNKQPDLALLDISMPGMSGVDILRECKRMEVKTRVIFISGFQDFEYAKAALTYGALDYLLKPVIREELLNALEKYLALSGIKEIKEEAEESVKTHKAYGRLIELEETSYIPVYSEILFDEEDNSQLRKLIRFSYKSFLEEYLEEKKIGICFQKNEHLVLVLKGMDREASVQITEELGRQAEAVTGHVVAFVIGEQVSGMGDIPEAFGRCLDKRGYFFFADQLPVPVIMAKEPVFTRKIEKSRLAEVKENLIDSVIRQNGEAFEQYFKQYGRMVCSMSEGKKEDACFYFCTVIQQMDDKIRGLSLPVPAHDMKDLLELGRSCNSYGSLLLVYRKELQRYSEAVQESIVHNDNKDILKAKEYIEKHYQENLTLGILAQEVHMNPYYFSSFFKKNAGENFKEYVNKVRMAHAVSLLLSTDMKTYEIAADVGFSDARAFTESFQRLYGETPSAYRKRVSGKNEGGKSE